MSIKTDLQKHIDDVAAKLLAEGLTAYTYSKKKAKRLTKHVVAPVYVHKLIDGFSTEIKKSMRKLRK